MVDAETLELLANMKSHYKTLVHRDNDLTQRLGEVRAVMGELMADGNALMRKLGEHDPFFFQAYVTGVVSLPEKWLTEKV